jgi:hypothetical protein
MSSSLCCWYTAPNLVVVDAAHTNVVTATNASNAPNIFDFISVPPMGIVALVT